MTDREDALSAGPLRSTAKVSSSRLCRVTGAWRPGWAVEHFHVLFSNRPASCRCGCVCAVCSRGLWRAGGRGKQVVCSRGLWRAGGRGLWRAGGCGGQEAGGCGGQGVVEGRRQGQAGWEMHRGRGHPTVAQTVLLDLCMSLSRR